MRSLTDMDAYFEQIDDLLRTEPMPREYAKKRSLVLCNDCGNKCVARFHFVYHKCDNESCKSYNTNVLDVFEVAPEDENGQDGRAGGSGTEEASGGNAQGFLEREDRMVEDGQFAKSPVQWSVRG